MVASRLLLVFVFLIEKTAAEYKTECGLLPADFVFLLDASGSETLPGFNSQKKFVANFSSLFTIGQNASQFAAVTFSTGVHNNFYLNQHQTQATLQNAIQDIRYENGETETHLGLDFVTIRSLSDKHGARNNVQKYVIVLTDGRSNEPALTVAAADKLHQLPNVTVIAIGIGSGVDTAELAHIATDSKHVFTVSNFDLLHTVEKELTDKTCTICSDYPADIAFLLDSSGSEGFSNFQKQKDFVSLISNELNYSQKDTLIAVAQFATNARAEIKFGDYVSKTALLQAIQNIRYLNGETRTDLGLNTLGSEIFTTHSNGHHHHHDAMSSGPRPSSVKIAIVLTDGRSNEPGYTIESAKNLHSQGVEVFVIGIGPSVDYTELNAIATDSSHVFRVFHFNDLDTIHNKLVQKICELKIPPPTTTPIPTTTPKPTTPKPTTTTVKTTTTTVKPECGQTPADIVFVLDSSESEKEENFQKEKTFVYNFARKFQIGPNNVQFSCVTFSSAVRNDFYLNTYNNRHDVLNAIQSLDYIGAGTNTSEALKWVRLESFLPIHGRRSNASQIVIVITDGQSANPRDTKHEAVMLHHSSKVYTIGVGSEIDAHELRAISSDGHPLSVQSFDLLHTIQDTLENKACAST